MFSSSSFIIFVVSVGMLIIFTWLGYMPFMGYTIGKASSTLLYQLIFLYHQPT